MLDLDMSKQSAEDIDFSPVLRKKLGVAQGKYCPGLCKSFSSNSFYMLN